MQHFWVGKKGKPHRQADRPDARLQPAQGHVQRVEGRPRAARLVPRQRRAGRRQVQHQGQREGPRPRRRRPRARHQGVEAVRAR